MTDIYNTEPTNIIESLRTNFPEEKYSSYQKMVEEWKDAQYMEPGRGFRNSFSSILSYKGNCAFGFVKGGDNYCDQIIGYWFGPECTVEEANHTWMRGNLHSYSKWENKVRARVAEMRDQLLIHMQFGGENFGFFDVFTSDGSKMSGGTSEYKLVSQDFFARFFKAAFEAEVRSPYLWTTSIPGFSAASRGDFQAVFNHILFSYLRESLYVGSTPEGRPPAEKVSEVISWEIFPHNGGDSSQISRVNWQYKD